MKATNDKQQAIIESGNYVKIECWQLTIQNYGNPITYYWTAGDATLTARAYTAAGYGPENTYVTGMNLIRDRITMKRGTQPGNTTLTVVPQGDNPAGPVLIAGYDFQQAARLGYLKGAIWLLLKGYFARPGQGPMISSTGFTYTPPNLKAGYDYSPGLIPYWAGITDQVDCGRFMADISLDEITALLANIQMPRNFVQPSCLHSFCDAGCTLNKSQNTYTGTVTSVTGNTILTSLLASSFADGYFGPSGILTFTSGALNGVSYSISNSGHISTNVTLTPVIPMPILPSSGDSFTALASCNKTELQCASGKFKLPSGSFGSNRIHFRGFRFVPNPETLYCGGAGSQDLPALGGQGRPGAGSPYTGNR